MEDRPIVPVEDHLTGSLAEPKATSLSAPGRAHSLEGESPLHTRQGEMLAEQQRRYREAVDLTRISTHPTVSDVRAQRRPDEPVSRGASASKTRKLRHGSSPSE